MVGLKKVGKKAIQTFFWGFQQLNCSLAVTLLKISSMHLPSVLLMFVGNLLHVPIPLLGQPPAHQLAGPVYPGEVPPKGRLEKQSNPPISTNQPPLLLFLFLKEILMNRLLGKVLFMSYSI